MSDPIPHLPTTDTASTLPTPIASNYSVDHDPDWSQLQIEEQANILAAYFNPNQDNAPIVRFVNQLLTNAIQQGASDIHLEPYESLCRIRFRQDGLLHTVFQPPLPVLRRLVSRLKVMAGLDIAEHRLPQDGRIKWLTAEYSIDLRVNTCPTLHGEKIVLRILDQSRNRLLVEELGLNTLQEAQFLHALQQPYGLILVTGPTGSGKTVSLYAALNRLNTVERNISTVEDPVEISVTGINQLHINHKIGLSFAEALRAFLRQDPDIIMVGEIRDPETAAIAIKAAQTGHLVLSTLHTNDAPETLTRLMQMGIEPYQIASALLLIIAQRLVRLLCPACKQPVSYAAHRLMAAGYSQNQLAQLQLYRAQGCHQCRQGYRGRTGIYQVMPMTMPLRQVIIKSGNSLDLNACIDESEWLNLRQSGLEKVSQGLTSLEEVERITRDA